MQPVGNKARSNNSECVIFSKYISQLNNWQSTITDTFGAKVQRACNERSLIIRTIIRPADVTPKDERNFQFFDTVD